MRRNLKLILFFAILMVFNTSLTFADTLPEIKGTSAIVMDASTGEMLYTKNIDTKLYPASTTKLMTALILAENNKPEDIFTYSVDSKSQEPFTIDYNIVKLTVSDKITAASAMDAMLICSANDITYMIYENAAGKDKRNFIDLMNKKALALNLKNTNFTTAIGLHNDNHYTTAYDLSVIARECYKYPWIMESMNKKQSTITTLNNTKGTYDTKNKLLNLNGCIGGKTGYTGEAGRCLVAYYERNNRKLVGVVLKSIYDSEDTIAFEDMEKIIDYSYSKEKDILFAKNTEIKSITKSYHLLPFNLGPKKEVKISLSLKDDVKVYNTDDKYNSEYLIDDTSAWKLNKTKSIGKVILSSRETTNTYEIYPSISSLDLFLTNIVFYLIILILILILVFVLRKFKIKKKKKNKYSLH